MLRQTLLAAALFAALPAAHAAEVKKTVGAVQLIENRLLERVSADGSVLLVRKSGAGLEEADGVVLNELRLRLSETDLWNLQPAQGLALDGAAGETPVPLPDGAYFTATTTRMSADGKFVAFGAGANGSLDAWRWQAGGALQRLVPEGRAWRSGVADISRDGRTVLGWLLPDRQSVPRTFLWTEDGGFSLLPDDMNLPFALSADGQRVFGTRFRGNFRQLLQRGARELFEQQMPFDNTEGAGDWDIVGVSADGQRLAGHVEIKGTSRWQGFLWDEQTGFVEQADPPMLERQPGGEKPDFDDFARRIRAASGMTDADRFTFLQTDAVSWQPGKGLDVIETGGVPAGMSARGDTLFAYQTDGWPPRLWQIDASGRTDLGGKLNVRNSYLRLLSVSDDGSRVWLRGDDYEAMSSGTYFFRDGKRVPLGKVQAAISPVSVSADGRTLAGIGATETRPQRYPAIVWSEATGRDTTYHCPGDSKGSGTLVLSGDGKVLATGQSGTKRSVICLRRIAP